MIKFENPFFSIAGQKERLANAGNTLLAAVTGQGVKSNTGVKSVDKVLSAAASNPFVTAGVAAVAVNPAAAGAVTKNAITSLTPKQAVVAAVATPVVIGAVASNPRLVGKAAKAPSELAQFGSDVGGLIAEPTLDRAKSVVKNSPVISGAIALGTAAVAGAGVTSAVINAANTRAVKKNTEALLGVTLPVPASAQLPATLSPGGYNPYQNEPLTPETTVVGREVRSGSVRKAKRKAKPSSVPPIRIQLLNQNTYIEA